MTHSQTLQRPYRETGRPRSLYAQTGRPAFLEVDLGLFGGGDAAHHLGALAVEGDDPVADLAAHHVVAVVRLRPAQGEGLRAGVPLARRDIEAVH